MTSGDARNKVKVMLVEDEALFRDLLQMALSQHGGFEVVGSFGDGEAALEAAESIEPDVAILDIELRSDMNGVQVGLMLRRKLPNVGIVLLSNHGTPEFLASLPRDEIVGRSYLLKKSVDDVSSLARAIDGVMAGFVVVDPQIVKAMQPRTEGRLSRLTPRQLEILGLIAQGYANGAIAEARAIGEVSRKSDQHHLPTTRGPRQAVNNETEGQCRPYLSRGKPGRSLHAVLTAVSAQGASTLCH